MKRTLLMLSTALYLTAGTAWAQDASYIQIEAQPSLKRAEDRLRDYASYLADVNGFALGGGWYGIALGPYTADDAAARLRRLRADGQVPRDSYIEEGDQYGQQFWPIGATGAATQEPVATEEPTTETAETPVVETTPEVVAEPAPEPVIEEPDETPRQARASEAELTREERADLQIALQWAGFYNGAIDAAFGRGTRGSMAAWQEANNFEVTGVLTTRQRAELKRQYNAVLDGLGMGLVTDARAGIAMDMPTAKVAFEKYESPFAHYSATDDLGARVLLISQPGDRDTLFGLYEIMQTLEIVPLDGPRERKRDGFVLVGENSNIVSHTEVSLEDGNTKGFTLIWPANDEERRMRVLAMMQSSFTVSNAVLDPAATSGDGQGVDLLSGLRIRTPRMSVSGFYVDGQGHVLTASNAVQNCGRITLDETTEADILAQDEALGVALLTPKSSLAPRMFAEFRTDDPRIQSEVAVAGYSYGGVLSGPTMTFGTLEDVKGLSGEDTLKRLALASLPGDAGGPVVDAGGAVVGMMLPRDTGARSLPDEVSFAAKASAIETLLSQSGVRFNSTSGGGVIAPEDLTEATTAMTVLVSCWD
ncbi:MAG: serine protease [Pseudomonadota bacterium]|nr:serine protease [Pseudomonadota bacterium]